MNMLRKVVFFVWTILVITGQGSLGAGEGSGDGPYEAVAARYWDWYRDTYPQFYSTYTWATYKSTRVDSYAPQAFLWLKDNATQLMADLQAVDREKISEQNLVNYDLLQDRLNNLITGYKWRFYGPSNPFNLNDSPLRTWLLYVGDSLKDKSVAVINKLQEWYRQLPSQLLEIETMMNKSIEMRTTHHISSMTGVVEYLDTELQLGANGSSFLQPFTDTHLASVTSNVTLRGQLQVEGRRLVRDVVIPAWQRMRDYMEQVYLPNTRPEEGVWSIPDGLEYYKACLRYHLHSDVTPQELFDLGMSKVARIGAEIDKVRVSAGYDGNIVEFMNWLKTEDPNVFQTEEEVLNVYRNIVWKTHAQLGKVMKFLTPWMLEVIAVPNPNWPAQYAPRPIDESRNAQFWAPVSNPSTRRRVNMVSLTMHEGEPGHHTENSYIRSQTKNSIIPEFRLNAGYGSLYKVPFGHGSYGTYAEGWALYAEGMAEQLGVYDDPDIPYAIMGKLMSEMFRACRLVVDTGMHVFRWNATMGADFFDKHTDRTPPTMVNELGRYLAWPGQACTYKVGQIHMQELKAYSEAELGSEFDQREFHDVVLRQYHVPGNLLEAAVQRWVAASKPVSEPISKPVSMGDRVAGSCWVLGVMLLAVFIVVRI